MAVIVWTRFLLSQEPCAGGSVLSMVVWSKSPPFFKIKSPTSFVKVIKGKLARDLFRLIRREEQFSEARE